MSLSFGVNGEGIGEVLEDFRVNMKWQETALIVLRQPTGAKRFFNKMNPSWSRGPGMDFLKVHTTAPRPTQSPWGGGALWSVSCSLQYGLTHFNNLSKRDRTRVRISLSSWLCTIYLNARYYYYDEPLKWFCRIGASAINSFLIFIY